MARRWWCFVEVPATSDSRFVAHRHSPGRIWDGWEIECQALLTAVFFHMQDTMLQKGSGQGGRSKSCRELTYPTSHLSKMKLIFPNNFRSCDDCITLSYRKQFHLESLPHLPLCSYCQVHVFWDRVHPAQTWSLAHAVDPVGYMCHQECHKIEFTGYVPLIKQYDYNQILLRMVGCLVLCKSTFELVNASSWQTDCFQEPPEPPNRGTPWTQG